MDVLKALLFIKDNYKHIVFFVLGAAVVYFFLRARDEHKRAVNAEMGRDAAIVLQSKWSNLTTFYKNKYGDQVLRVKALQMDKENLEEVAKTNQLFWLNKFNGLKKDKSNIQSATTFETTFKPQKIVNRTIYVPCKDSIKAFKYVLKDQYNFISAMVLDTPKFYIKDRYYVAIESHRPKGWFWKFKWSKREIACEITNSNKMIKIDSASTIIIR